MKRRVLVFWLLALLTTGVWATEASAQSAQITTPQSGSKHAVNGTYTFAAVISPIERVWSSTWCPKNGLGTFLTNGTTPVTYRADQKGTEVIELYVYFDMDLDGLPDALAYDSKTIYQYDVQLLDDTGYSALNPPEPEQVPAGLLAPRMDPIKTRFSIDGPVFPVTVKFQSFTIGTGAISHASTQMAQSSGTYVIDGASGDGTGPGRVTGTTKSTYRNDVELDIRIGGASQNEGIGGTIYLTVADVIDVVWKEKYTGQITSNPATGGGRRLFPGKHDLDDETNRRRVRVEAEIDPRVSGEVVWFADIDVDDPSADDSPIDPQDSASKHPGDDNSPFSSAGFQTNPPKIATDGDGLAEIEYETSLCAGDNFRVASGFDAPYLSGVTYDEDSNGINLIDSSSTQLDTILAKATEMLTIWRMLHIERDHMSVASGNYIDGGEITELDSGDGCARYSLSLRDESNDRDSGTQGDGRFQGGKLLTLWGTFQQDIAANGEYDIFAEATGGFRFQCDIRASGETTIHPWIMDLTPDADAEGRTKIDFSNYDVPDDYEGGTLALGSSEWTIEEVDSGDVWIDGASTVTIAVLSVWDDDDNTVEAEYPLNDIVQDSDDDSENVLARAYVLPQWDGGGGSYDNGDVTFQLNVLWTIPGVSGQINAGAGSNSTAGPFDDEFWQAYVQGSFQGGETRDADSNSEAASFGNAPDVGVWGALIYRQAFQDVFDHRAPFNTWSESQRAVRMARTTAHEIGHQFGLVDQSAGAGLMSSEDLNQNLGGEVHFNDIDIDDIRSSPSSPGDR